MCFSKFARAAVAVAASTVSIGAHAQSSHPVTVHLKTSNGADAGDATFRETKSGELSIKVDLKNLPPGDHGIHIHEKAICDAPDFKGAGGHFDPDAKQHGYNNPQGHHNGDLPQNLTVAADGTAHQTFMVRDLSIGTGKPNDIIGNGTQISNGTAIMIHAGPDDMKSDPAGNSGGRIACGVIQGNEATKPGAGN